MCIMKRKELVKKLKKAGFVLSERLVNAIEYGVPQDRDRIILIGFQKSKAKQLWTNLTYINYYKENVINQQIFIQFQVSLTMLENL